MHPANHSLATQPRNSLLLLVGFCRRLLVLAIPAALLFGGSLRYPEEPSQILLFGATFQVLICAIGLLTPAFWQRSIFPVLVLLYGIALLWVFLAQPPDDWYLHLSQALLLIIPLGLFAFQSLEEIGAPALRRARVLASRLAARREWPTDLESCRNLPEVKALHEALYLDAAPALELLRHPRAEVRMAALAALDFRSHWRPGQAECVLQVGLRAEEPGVRAAALGALANIQDRVLIEALAEFLRDPSPVVRRAAADALLWDVERRWNWIRHAVRRCLGDPLCQEDGPLRLSSQSLTPEAVADLTAWASEKGLLGFRAAQTIGRHYHHALTEGTDRDLVAELRAQVVNPQLTPVLRIELTRLLHAHNQLSEKVLFRLLDPSNPAPLRLLAVEAMLSDGKQPVEAMNTLRDLARLPNREIAMATADVIQRQLKVELGLAANQPPPPLHSRQANEISRRVRLWATQHDVEEDPGTPFPRMDKRSWHTISEI